MPDLKAKGKSAIVHVGDTFQRSAVELAEHAASLGADAVASIPPRTGWKQIGDYYRALAKAGLPVIVYYIPGVTGMTASLPELMGILEIDGVCGIKMRKQAAPDKIVYSGFDELLLYGLLSGADGLIGTWANLFAPMYIKMYALVKAKRHDDALALQSRFSAFLGLAWRFGVIDAFEELMYALGSAKRCFRRPGTWNPGKIPPESLNKLLEMAGELISYADTL